ncbi:hypothetical protein HDU76_012316, partial [Blyttiomyces sp. JEL0837]
MARNIHPLAKSSPSPYVPISDFVVHVLLIIFWVSAITDFGVRMTGCDKRAKDAGVDGNVCLDLKVVVALGCAC